ncbi:D-2-hydroxyacid dehydrogenase family protein [Tengunoibacter tsumagoiensis]|uniref:Glyoxylate reductase n=1 Tax=Tengunoibacter tsumagoiensis TaxID=2014871 RepID=A0A402AA95_9CHLR|nr:D-2-hydroxyacid dehydrogenase family protein [Tengunoibacter tsumagoiensis]GCE16018.1 glyoxylate reductase [Tengunoibacter tsumagoiensis]
MKIAIPDDYQDAIPMLDCFAKLAEHDVVSYHNHISDPKMLAEQLREAEALVLIRERTPITEDLLALLPKLTLIVQTGRQAPHLDLAACTRHGVSVIYATPTTPSVSSSTAELTWGLILAALRFIPQEIASMKAGQWQHKLGRTLYGSTLGIFGYGTIGKMVAGYGRAFGMKVLVWGREGSRDRARSDGFEVATDQEALFTQSDVLTLHITLKDETRGIVSLQDLLKMKSSALLVNTSRAGLIAPGALEEALRAGRPGYAAVDVYEHEPVKDHPLLQMENVLCTPHIGYVEKESYERLLGAAFDQLVAFASGNRDAVANPETLKQV